jgi:hypothetical protein
LKESFSIIKLGILWILLHQLTWTETATADPTSTSIAAINETSSDNLKWPVEVFLGSWLSKKGTTKD